MSTATQLALDLFPVLPPRVMVVQNRWSPDDWFLLDEHGYRPEDAPDAFDSPEEARAWARDHGIDLTPGDGKWEVRALSYWAGAILEAA